MKLSGADHNRLELLTPSAMYMVDKAAIEYGTDSKTLMYNAGVAVANSVQKHWPYGDILVLCGPGNNGGDGFVAAQRLVEYGRNVSLVLCGNKDKLSSDARYFATRYQGEILPFCTSILSENISVVIDALFGAGLSRPLNADIIEFMNMVSDRQIPVCAVDVPSGLCGTTGKPLGNTSFRASRTLTFFCKKVGHLLQPGRQLCGIVEVADIGISKKALKNIKISAYENSPTLWLHKMKWPHHMQHKYLRGHVVVMGSDQYIGATKLAAISAARGGAGLVTVAATENTMPIYQSALTSIMVKHVSNEMGLDRLLSDKRINIVLTGPGFHPEDNVRKHVLKILSANKAVVLDAGAITSFSANSAELFNAISGPCVMTPHIGEFKQIFGDYDNKLEAAREASIRSNSVIVLKGSDTVIACPNGEAIINSNAPAWLATAGSGDVLAGLVAGLMATGMQAFDAAAAAVWIHGEAANMFGVGLIAEDIPVNSAKVMSLLYNQYLQQQAV